jgi:hypothetical protein
MRSFSFPPFLQIMAFQSTAFPHNGRTQKKAVQVAGVPPNLSKPFVRSRNKSEQTVCSSPKNSWANGLFPIF